ncbi:MAG TPA: cyclic nucleotide-binding domain-containing protein [Burkholderiales bacterium]|nr:cyclic nucleotide-binding domain-containing protein [Burkholderiales bacterium]
MGDKPDPGVVARSPLGVELEQEDCRTLAGAMTVRRLADADVLIEEGHVDDALHVIVSGALAVTRNTAGGTWVTLQLLRQGDIAGELGFLDGKEHSATLRATGATQVYSLQRPVLESLLEAHPQLVYRVMRAIVRTVHAILLRMNLEYVELTNYITKQHGRY